MKKPIFILLTLFILTSLATQLSCIQKPLCRYIERVLQEKTGEKIEIDTLSAIFPICLWATNISTQNTHISSLFIIPSLPDLIFGRLGAHYVSVDTVDITAASGLNTDQINSALVSKLPPISVNLYSVKCAKMTVTGKPSISIHTSLFWNPTTKIFASKGNISSTDGEDNIITSSFDIHTSPKEFIGKFSVELLDLLPATRLKKAHSTFTFTSQHPLLLEPIWGSSHMESQGDIATGSYEVTTLYENETTLKDTSTTLQAKGTYAIHSLQTITIVNSKLAYSQPERITLPYKPHAEISPSYIKRTVAHDMTGVITATLSYLDHAIRVEATSDRIVIDKFVCSTFNTVFTTKHAEPGFSGSLQGSCFLDRVIDIANEEESSFLKYDPLPISFATSWKYEGKSAHCSAFELDALAIKAGESDIHGSLQFFFHPFLVKGNIEGKIDNAMLFSKILQQQLSGNGRFSLAFDPMIKNKDEYLIEQNCLYTSSWSELSLSKLPHYSSTSHHSTTPMMRCGKAHLAARASGLFPTPKIEVHFNAEKIAIKELHVPAVTCNISSDLSREIIEIPFQFESITMAQMKAVNTGITGTIKTPSLFSEMKNRYIELVDITATMNQKRASLSHPLRIEYDYNSITLLPFELVTQESSDQPQVIASGSGSVNKRGTNVDIQFTHCPVGPLHLMFPDISFVGSYSGRLLISGTQRNPKLYIALSSNTLVYQLNTLESIPLQASFEANIHQDICQAFLNIKSPDTTQPLLIQATLPCQLSLRPPQWHFYRDKPITGSIKGEGDLTLIRSLFDEDQTLEGLALLDLQIFGSFDSPKLSGHIELKNGAIDIPQTGCRLSHLNIQAEAREDSISLHHFEGTDGENGSFYGSGILALQADEKFPFELDLTVKNMKLLQKDLITVAATGNGSLTSNRTHMQLQAALVLDSGCVDLNEQPATDIPPLNVIYHFQGQQLHPITSSDRPFFMKLDISIANNPIIIKGLGLNTDWIGHLVVTGTPDELAFEGSANCSKGFYSLGGKKCPIIKGKIDWNGPILTHSQALLQAVAPSADIEAYITLSGSLARPLFAINSYPPFPQKELLSRVVFNKPLADISPIEALQLAHILLSVNAQKNNHDFFQKIKKSLGIDTLEIAHSSHQSDPTKTSNAVSIQVGKYLSHGVFVRLSKDVINAVNRVGIEAKIFKNICVQAEVGDDASHEVRLKWKKDW